MVCKNRVVKWWQDTFVGWRGCVNGPTENNVAVVDRRMLHDPIV